jgi:hypothetical protein
VRATPSTSAASGTDITREQPELDNVRGQGIFGRELVESIVQLQQPVWLRAGDPVGGLQLDPRTPVAVFVGLLPPCTFDKNTPHGLRSGSEEMTPAVPVLRLVDIDQPKVGLVDQGRCLECLAGLLLGEFLGGELAQLLVDQG